MESDYKLYNDQCACVWKLRLYRQSTTLTPPKFQVFNFKLLQKKNIYASFPRLPKNDCKLNSHMPIKWIETDLQSPLHFELMEHPLTEEA